MTSESLIRPEQARISVSAAGTKRIETRGEWGHSSKTICDSLRRVERHGTLISLSMFSVRLIVRFVSVQRNTGQSVRMPLGKHFQSQNAVLL